MLVVENTEIFGWEAAVRGMRNPKNSWNKSDSQFTECLSNDNYFVDYTLQSPYLGKNDLELMKSLAKAGNDHAKFLRMINVTCDITAPLYWWKEYDTYKVGTVANSCSTMHKITSKEIELSDFSIDNVYMNDDYVDISLKDMFINVVADCEDLRKKYLETNDKRYWKGLIQLLPNAYNQKRTVQLNYAVLKNIYFARKNHKLDEWHTFCHWALSLPYLKEICVGDVDE